MTGAAPPGDERYVPSGDAAETDAWRLIAERLRGGNAVIAADELTARAREAGGAVTLAEGRQLALRRPTGKLIPGR